MTFHQFTTETGESYGSFEVFHAQGRENVDYHDLPEFQCITGAGFYWQACFPGCIPDGDAIGPFDSETAAIADADPYRTES